MRAALSDTPAQAVEETFLLQSRVAAGRTGGCYGWFDGIFYLKRIVAIIRRAE